MIFRFRRPLPYEAGARLLLKAVCCRNRAVPFVRRTDRGVACNAHRVSNKCWIFAAGASVAEKRH